MAMSLKRPPHYLALDGLRGVAALAVVLLHVAVFFRLSFVPGHAYLAVDFFFMLSGFVIARAYSQRLENGLAVREFLAIRLIRLYPLVLLGVVLGTIALLGATRFTSNLSVSAVLKAAITNALLLPSSAMNDVRPSAFPVDGPLWSLAFEIWINILYAWFFRFWTNASLSAALILGALLTCWTSIELGGLNVGFGLSDFYLGGARVLFPFVAGVILSRIMKPVPAGYSWAHLAFAPLLFVLVAPIYHGGFYDAFAVLFVFPVILFIASNASQQSRLNGIWRRLGALSYPLYVTHYPFIVVASEIAHQRHLTGFALCLSAAITMLCVLVFSALSLQFYDIPVRRMLSQQSGALVKPRAV
jgi:peptidoglycan/LPS O-acetylase OafA/YrhL